MQFQISSNVDKHLKKGAVLSTVNLITLLLGNILIDCWLMLLTLDCVFQKSNQRGYNYCVLKTCFVLFSGIYTKPLV